MHRAGRMDRRRTTRAATAALAAVMALAVAPGAAMAGGGALPPPPLTSPQVTAVSGLWVSELVSAQDKTDCVGRFTPFGEGTMFNTFRESRETWQSAYSTSSDPRYSGSITFYLHILRNITPTDTGEIGKVDGTYAVFDGNRAIATGQVQGVLVRQSSYDEGSEQEISALVEEGGTEGIVRFQGLLFGGSVIYPAAATIGQPHLVANFLSFFGESASDPAHNFDFWAGGYGDEEEGPVSLTEEDSWFGGPAFPAVVVGGTCPGPYKTRPAPVEQPPAIAKQARSTGKLSQAQSKRQAAYVRRLYERTH